MSTEIDWNDDVNPIKWSGSWRNPLMREAEANNWTPVYYWAERQRRLAEFQELPPRIRNILMGNAYKSRQEVAETPDIKLLRVYGLGPSFLKQLRTIIPFVAPVPIHNPVPTSVGCPICHGTGKIPEAVSLLLHANLEELARTLY